MCHRWSWQKHLCFSRTWNTSTNTLAMNTTSQQCQMMQLQVSNSAKKSYACYVSAETRVCLPSSVFKDITVEQLWKKQYKLHVVRELNTDDRIEKVIKHYLNSSMPKNVKMVDAFTNKQLPTITASAFTKNEKNICVIFLDLPRTNAISKTLKGKISKEQIRYMVVSFGRLFCFDFTK